MSMEFKTPEMYNLNGKKLPKYEVYTCPETMSWTNM